MEVTGDDVTAQNPQNLNELQSLLVSFNKEIEDQPSILVQSVIDQQNQQLYVTPSTSNISSDSQAIVDGSTKQTFAGFYTEQSLLDASIQDENEGHMTVTVTAPSESQEHGIHVASLASQRDNSSATSLNDSLQSAEDLPIQAFNPSDLATLNDAEGNVLRIVSIGNDGQMHIINEDQLQQGSEVTTDVLTHHIGEKGDGGEATLDGTDPVAVLASVAANTSSVSQIQTVTLNQGDVNNPQLVAIQNSADSSQPQLVAVQNADGSSTEAVQIIGGSEVANINQTLMATPNNAFQTVTLVPSETGPGGEVSYVLIMGSPDGENIVDGKALSLDLSGYEFKEEDREVTEELVEEDGKTRRILRITPKTTFVSGVGGQMMCSYCNYTSPKRYLLTRHMKTHSEDRPHKCHICGRGFKTLASLTNHVNTHTGVRPHKCKLCESAFTTSGELVRHVRYKHTFEKPHKCTLCEYASVELSKLKRHMRSHTGERPYQCPHCTYASPDTYKLKRHLRIHTGEKPYECMVCHARFTQSNSLKAHKLIHTGTKPVFQCEFCPTTCGRRTDLKIHVQKLHNSEHPLLCRKCDQTFPDRYTYKIHLKSHEGEKCFKCETCGHAAISQRHLETHQLIHTGEKPFECNSCDQSFRQKQLLKRHQSLHHSSGEAGESTEKEDCHTVTSQYISLVSSSDNQSENTTGSEATDVSNELITQNILEKNLMQEWREGKLGNAQQVVIVHPDGTVEEVTHKLHGFQASQIQGDDESIELKPDISQIVIQRPEEKSEDEASGLVISSIDATDQTIDETKEAGTQAEFEVEMDGNKSHVGHSEVTTQSMIHAYQTTEQSLNQNIQSENLEEFNHSEEQAVDQEDVDESLQPEEAVFQQDEYIEALEETEVDAFTGDDTEEDPHSGNPDSMEGDEESSSQYLVQPDIIPNTHPLTDMTPHDIVPCSIVQTFSTDDQKLIPVSPNRQTRSMKRKEDIEAQSPAKRTRRSTMDS